MAGQIINTVDKSKPVPAYRQIQNFIRKKIDEENLPVDTLLPSEQDLVKVHNVSRMTARQAIMGLVSENVVYRINGKGTFVASTAEENQEISTGSVGIIIPNLGKGVSLDNTHSPTFYLTLLGAQHIFGEHDYDVTILARKSDRLNLEILKSSPVSGFLVLYPNKTEKELLINLMKCGRPFVAVNTPLIFPNINRADFNMNEAGKKVAEHLIERGKKKIAFICDENNNPGREWFYEGLRDILTLHGLAAAEIKLENNSHGDLSLGNLTGVIDNYNAVVATNDSLAAKIINEVSEMGIKIPNDVAVTGYSNSSIAEKVNPSLTSFRLPFEKLGEEAARLLLKDINVKNHEKEMVTATPELIVRNST